MRREGLCTENTWALIFWRLVAPLVFEVVEYSFDTPETLAVALFAITSLSSGLPIGLLKETPV